MSEAISAVNQWSNAHGWPEEAFVPSRVAAWAKVAPDAVAVASESGKLTYRELNARADHLARRLARLGVGAEALVAVCLPRSLDLIVGALGILKAGAAYIPLDPTYPPDRIGMILEDAKAPFVLANERFADALPEGPWEVVSLPGEGHEVTPEWHGSPAEISGQQRAYVIYTSGSTGHPKGVQIAHDSLMNLVGWHRNAFGIGPQDRAAFVSSPGFDAAVWEVWPYLTAGASVHIVGEMARLAPQALQDWILESRITMCFLPAPMADAIVTLPWPKRASLRYLLTGADVVHRHPPEGLPFAVVNNYGPTECTVVSTSGLLAPDRGGAHPPAIGRPISNAQVHILGDDLEPVRPGAIGELHVGGKGLARGYLNRPDATAERYIPDLFSSEPGERLYRTGDMARQLPDGQILFVGRSDNQIKIRGHRIEPGEIEALLRKHESVQDCLVVARKSSRDDHRLTAYIVPVPGVQTSPAALRGFLGQKLPEAMVPTTLVRLGALPLTTHGKPDRAALPDPDVSNTMRDDAFTAPRTLVEECLAGILAPLLGLETVGTEDNFFMLGGHSLLGAQVIARVRDTFGVELSLLSLFDAPTIADLSAEIERLIVERVEEAGPQGF